jgi:Fe-S-cluster-containing dehydrogenase component
MAKYGMVIDVTRCNGCYNCFLTCRDEYWNNDYPPYSLAQPFSGHFWLRIIERERGKYPRVKVAYTPVLCMHCENPPCVHAAENNAVYKRPDGIVMIDPEKAAGQKQIVGACPYRVIYWNEEKNIPQKCTLCAHLLDQGWKEPRCAEACPTQAMVFGDMDDPKSEISKLIASGKAEVIHPEYGLKEKVSYVGLPKRFIAATVIFGDKDECAGNVNITLTGQGGKQTSATNNFGDFEFEGLEADQQFSVKVEHPGYTPQSFKVQTKADVYLGEIFLKRSRK